MAAAGGASSPGETANSFALRPADAAELAYAVYTVGGLSLNRPVSLDLEVQQATTSPGSGELLPISYWVGISDYTAAHWEWHGPFDTPQRFVLNSEDINQRYISATNNLSFVVLCDPRQSGAVVGAEVVSVEVGTLDASDPDYFSTKPIYTPLQTAKSGSRVRTIAGKAGSALDPDQYVTLTWEHTFDPADGGNNEAFIYQLFRQRVGDSELLPIGSVLAPEESYVDPTDNAGGVSEPVPGESYTYYLRAVNNNGFTPFEPAPDVDVAMPAPGNVSATDGTHTDKVVLTWEASFTADGYRIFRDDNTGAPMATVGDVTTWEDLTVNADEHTYWVQAYDSTRDLASELSVSDTGYVNALPIPAINADVTSGLVPLTVNFTAAASEDPDATNTIVTYEWDYDGNFGYDTSRVTPDFSWTFKAPRTYDVKLRVTDDEGSTAETSVTITVDPWDSAVLDTPGSIVEDVCLTVLGSGPGISYYARTTGPAGEDQLRFVGSTVADGSSWIEPIVVDSGPAGSGMGEGSSLRVFSTLPCIAYLLGSELRFVRAANAGGTGWNPPSVVTTTADGPNVQLHQWTPDGINTYPSIAYFDTSIPGLVYRRAQNVNGSAWDLPTIIDTGSLGGELSLISAGGLPAVCYFDYAAGDLLFTKATSSTGGSWAIPRVVHSDNATEFCTLTMINSLPAVAFHANGMVHYSRASDADGTLWSTPSQLGNGTHCSLRPIDGRPCVAFWNAPTLMLRWATDLDGTVWPEQYALDVPAGAFPSLRTVENQPGIGYVTNADEIKFIRHPDS